MTSHSTKPWLARAPRLLRFVLFALSICFMTVAASGKPAYSYMETICDFCDPRSGGGFSNFGGSSNVPFSYFTPSGSEMDANLGVDCGGTEFYMQWDPGQPFEIQSMTYNLQITDKYGNLVDEQTGDLRDVGNPNGYITIDSKVAVPDGGAASLNVNMDGQLNGANHSVDAGALFSGVRSGC
jgi:hypothetical protein